MSYRFNAGESVQIGLRRVATEQIDAALAELQDEQLDRGQAIHQVRKRCKKLRGLVRLVRPAFADYDRENAGFRDAARSLSGMRDAESTSQAFEKLLEYFAEELNLGTFQPVRCGLEDRRQQMAQQECELEERLDAFSREMRKTRERVGTWPLNAKGFNAIGEGLVETYRRGRIAMAAAYEERTPARFHEWRKRAKDHWYHVRLVREVWKPLMKQRRQALKDLTDLLGDDHDLAVLRQLLVDEPERYGKSVTVQATIGLLDRRRMELQAEAKALGKRIYAGSPKKVGKRTRCYWKAWWTEVQHA